MYHIMTAELNMNKITDNELIFTIYTYIINYICVNLSALAAVQVDLVISSLFLCVICLF